MDAIAALHAGMKGSLACCGLDPDLRKLPPEILGGSGTDEEKTFEFLKLVVAATAPHICAFKAQKAFFDLLSGGHDLLREIIAHIHHEHPGLPVIVDCKIGDIGNTMDAYIENLFGKIDADGLVVNPYMGDDVLRPLADIPGKAIVVLAKTSNPDGAVIQDIVTQDGRRLWEVILDLTFSRWDRHGTMVPVIASTAEIDLLAVRQMIPDQSPILFAGVGAQGGSFSELAKLLNAKRSGAFVNSSRGILYPSGHENESVSAAIGRAALDLKTQLETVRRQK